jgi:hypothetical protein
MTFMVVDTYSYDEWFGLDFLIKICAIMDAKPGLIQIRHGPRANVEVLPLIMVNMLQRMNSEALKRDVIVALENTHIIGGLDMTVKNLYQYDSIMSKGVDAPMSDSNTNTNNSEH